MRGIITYIGIVCTTASLCWTTNAGTTTEESLSTAVPDLLTVNLAVIFQPSTETTTELDTSTTLDDTSTFDSDSSLDNDTYFVMEQSFSSESEIFFQLSGLANCAIGDTDLNTTQKWLAEIWKEDSSIPAYDVPIDKCDGYVVEYHVRYTMKTVEENGYDEIIKVIGEGVDSTIASSPDGLTAIEVDTEETKNHESNQDGAIEEEVGGGICESLLCGDREVCSASDLNCLDALQVCEKSYNCTDNDSFLSRKTTPQCKSDDNNSTAYCDCGSWLDLENFYDGEKCINLALLIIICAGGVGLILLILLITIACLVCSRNQLQEDNQQLKENVEDDLEYAFDKPAGFESSGSNNKSWSSKDNDAWRRYSGASGENVALSSYRDKKQARDMPGSKTSPYKENEISGYDNQTYNGDSGSLNDISLDEVMQTEAYKQFQPDLSNIDTKTQYQIRRPHITLRPNDNYTNVRDEEVGFRI